MIPEEYEEGRELEDWFKRKSVKNIVELESTKYKSHSEKFIGNNNPNMIYVDAPYHDFLIPIEPYVTRTSYIKLESIMMRCRGREINFRINRGVWVKSKGADYIVCIKEDKIYFGSVNPINNYIKGIMTDRQREKSYERGRHSKNRAEINRTPERLEELGLLKSIQISEANNLEELIKEDYKQNCFSK